MGALISETKKSILREQESLKKLLREYLNKCFVTNRTISISAECLLFKYLNTINIEDYYLDEDEVYLCNGNFEVHIDLKISKIEYDESEECFTIKTNEMIINLYFI